MSTNLCNPIPVPQTADDFRAMKPEFADPVKYPDNEIQLWIDAASCMLNPCIWGNLLGLGTVSFVAYNLAIYGAFMDPASVAAGAVPGTGATGLIASAAAGAVSVSYDNAAVIDPSGGIWNQNMYGRRFKWLMDMVGHRPLQLNVPPWGGTCGCGAFDYGGWTRSGRSGTLGPGVYYRDDATSENVPVGKFLPTTPPGTVL